VGGVDTLLTQLSAAYYKIALTAPEDTRQLAWDLRESVFAVWRKARDHPDSSRYQDDMKKVRDLTAKFRSHVAAELNLTNVSREDDSELSQLQGLCLCASAIQICLLSTGRDLQVQISRS
jgi:hypothetical protein